MQAKTQYIDIPLESLSEDPNQPRRSFNTDGDRNRLVLSLKEIGIQQPLSVKKVGKEKYVIIDGHRRFRCAKDLGWQTVSSRVLDDVTAAEVEKIRFEVQNNRRQWKPLERAEVFASIKRLAGFRTNKELADHLYLSETLVCNSLQLLEQKEDYKKLMDEFELQESYRMEFVKLLPKIRRIRDFGVDDIIRNLFQRVAHHVIQTSKDFRSLGRVFLRATANEDMLYVYLKDADMTVAELERHTIQSGYALNVEQVIQKTCKMMQEGVAFTAKEIIYLRELRELLSKVEA